MGSARVAFALAVAAVVCAAAPREAAASVFAPGFSTEVVLTELDQPVAVRFAPDGSVFVAEKAGLVKRFDPLPESGTGSATGRVVLDLRAEVGTYADRGLLGLAIDPAFPLAPYLYVLYTTDAPPGMASPMWNDSCGGPGQPDPIMFGGGCVATGRLVRFALSGDQVIGSTVLVEDGWYQQFASHSVGDLAFGPDGMLYASGGEGASFLTETDVGDSSQISTLYPNPGDPIAEGGALRAQDALTTGDPLGYSGSVIRVDPTSGPIAGGAAGPIVAFGLRNPYRMAFRPGTRELYVGDVGTRRAEEVNRIADTTDAVIENFGWPCREGERSTPYSSRPMCLAAAGTTTGPHFHYVHGHAPGAEELAEPCYAGMFTALTGVAFYAGTRWPRRLHGALVITDYELGCLFALPADATTGIPDPDHVEVIGRGVGPIVDISPGPGNDLYLASLAGTVLRLRYTPVRDPNSAPPRFAGAGDGEPPSAPPDAPPDRGGCATSGDQRIAAVLLGLLLVCRRRR